MRLNLGNIYDDYFEYEIMKKYFIIWYISPDKTYEEEVSVNKYAEALLEEYVRWSLGFIEINPKWAVPNNDGMPDRVRHSELDFDSQMKNINKLLFDTNKKLVNVSNCIYKRSH